jgi:nucleoside-diphosphate-sugar epimerase
LVMSSPEINYWCLVTGATGWLGRHVVRMLLKRGHAVLAHIRASGEKAADERFAELREFAGEGTLELHEGAWPPIPNRVETVIHCAALVDFVREEGSLNANVGLTWDLLRAAAQLPTLRRVLHVSSLTIRADSPIPFSERHRDTGQRFVSPYALTKFLAETLIERFHRPLPVTIVRTGSVLATRDGSSDYDGWFQRTVRLWLQGRLHAVPLAPSQRIHPIAVDDLADALVELLNHDDLPPVLHLPYRRGPTAETLFRRMGAAVGIRRPRLLAQHSEPWRLYREALPPLIQQAIDRLYPPPPSGSRLAEVRSPETRRWFCEHGLDVPAVPPSFWTNIARLASATALP